MDEASPVAAVVALANLAAAAVAQASLAAAVVATAGAEEVVEAVAEPVPVVVGPELRVDPTVDERVRSVLAVQQFSLQQARQ